MQTRQAHRLKALHNAKLFLETHTDRLPGVANGGAKQLLDGVIAEFVDHAWDQRSNDLRSQGSTHSYHELRKALIRDHLAPICALARVKFAGQPELHLFKLPRGNPHCQTLAAAAKVLADNVDKYRTVFIEAGLPGDSTTRLREVTKAMCAAMADRTLRRGGRLGAGTGLRLKLAEGRRILHALDMLVKSEAHGDPALLSAWKDVIRVGLHAPRRATELAQPAPLAALPSTDAKLLTDGAEQAPSAEQSSASGMFARIKRLVAGKSDEAAAWFE